jgi:hypothetical protein
MLHRLQDMRPSASGVCWLSLLVVLGLMVFTWPEPRRGLPALFIFLLMLHARLCTSLSQVSPQVLSLAGKNLLKCDVHMLCIDERMVLPIWLSGELTSLTTLASNPD